jgi:hypothetical protein
VDVVVALVVVPETDTPGDGVDVVDVVVVVTGVVVVVVVVVTGQ